MNYIHRAAIVMMAFQHLAIALNVLHPLLCQRAIRAMTEHRDADARHPFNEGALKFEEVRVDPLAIGTQLLLLELDCFKKLPVPYRGQCLP